MKKYLYLIFIYIICSSIILCSCKFQYIDKCFGCYVCLPICSGLQEDNWETDREIGVYINYTDRTCILAKGPIPSEKVDMEELVIPKKFANVYTIVEIEEYAFYEYRVKSIRLPNSIMKIGKKIIYGCDKLETIYFEGTMEQWLSIKKDDNWDEGSPNYTIICTDGSLEKGFS